VWLELNDFKWQSKVRHLSWPRERSWNPLYWNRDGSIPSPYMESWPSSDFRRVVSPIGHASMTSYRYYCPYTKHVPTLVIASRCLSCPVYLYMS